MAVSRKLGSVVGPLTFGTSHMSHDKETPETGSMYGFYLITGLLGCLEGVLTMSHIPKPRSSLG